LTHGECLERLPFLKLHANIEIIANMKVAQFLDRPVTVSPGISS
jgi:hypothetical protein